MSVFKKGNSLADPGLWANRANATALLVVLINAVLGASKAFGYELPIEQEQVGQAAEIISMIGLTVVAGLHTASNKEAGHE